MFLRALIVMLLWVSVSMAQRNVHERWEGQLERYVAPTGAINYSDWKKEVHGLVSYLKALEDHPPPPNTKWNPKWGLPSWIIISKILDLRTITPWSGPIIIAQKFIFTRGISKRQKLR